MDQYIGRLLDNRYEILEILGTGGMAVVYKARCHRLNRLVAIKILKDEYARDEEFRRRFRAEGEAVAMLSHPNIVQVYDVSSSDTANFIVMELVDGISLKQYMEKKGVLNWKETLHFAIQIAKGLEHAHSRGIVHRDIKPHNVMVLKNGSVKVMDFGIARVMSKSNTLTKEALGSVHYISPEQAKGGWVDNRSDLYSLSVVMYEMMAGRPPYDGESPVAVAIQHINGGAAMPSTLNPNIPGGLEQIIMKGMSLDANDRYPSATAMLKDMDEFRKNPGILFDYSGAAPVSLDATQSINLGGAGRQTTADKVARRTEGGGSTRQNTRNASTNDATNRFRAVGTAGVAGQRSNGQYRQNGTQRRMPGNEDRSYPPQRKNRKTMEAERRSRVTTMAIIGCSVVAVIAIVIWLVALINGALFNQSKELVEVPNLIGDIYAPIMEGFTVEYGKPAYSDTADENTIINQEPKAGDMVQKGTTITVNVSLGPAPQVKTMTNLAGQTLEDAKAFLTNQGMNPLGKEEYSDTVEEGKVIRTDPEVGTELTDGQTVYVYYSVGPVIKTATMPNLIGQNYATAYSLLTQLGFSNVSSEPVESNEPKDEVVEQPYERGTQVDITEKIVLKISKGPKTTEKMPNVVGMTYASAKMTLNNLGFTNVGYDYVESDKAEDTVVEQPFRVNAEVNKAERITLKISEGPKPTETTAPPATEPEPVTVVATFTLPTERTETYVLSIFYNGTEVVDAQEIEAGTASITVKLSGNGKKTYDLYINDEFYNSQEVNFGD